MIKVITRNPIVSFFALIISTIIITLSTTTFATMKYVDSRHSESMNYTKEKHNDIKNDIKEIKTSIQNINNNILKIYKGK